MSATGQQLRDAGIEQAGSGVAVASATLWTLKAQWAVGMLAKEGYPFTAENVRDLAGDPPIPNMMGSVLKNAYKDGLIQPDGYEMASRPERHAAVLRRWVRKA